MFLGNEGAWLGEVGCWLVVDGIMRVWVMGCSNRSFPYSGGDLSRDMSICLVVRVPECINLSSSTPPAFLCRMTARRK